LNRDVVLAPTFTNLETVKRVIDGTKILLAAQNVCWEEKGAFTGEVSPIQLKDVGCDYVIIGHSERRNYFKESDEIINKKLKSVFLNSMVPILCIGEKLEERENNKTFEVLDEQISKALETIPEDWVSKMVIAYEPVWAIGTGRNATPFQAQEAHSFIRGRIRRMFSVDAADVVRIIYGGSITPENFMDIVRQPDVDGGLVGGASLDIEKFTKIIKYAR
ncbi:MAG: triose-phosphate isomerase, partial [bacterium]|nr:triose-phosphate isomerase [bacterium]